MKLKLIVAAAALAASQAYAVAPWTAADIEIFISGSSSQDENIGNYIEQYLCEDDFDTFYDSYTNYYYATSRRRPVTKRFRAWSCKVDSYKVPGTSPGQVLLIHKRSMGGSGWGVVPVARQLQIERMDLPNANCEELEDFPGSWKCDLVSELDTPLVGVSDVQPQVFKGLNAVAAFGDVTQADLDALTTFAQSQLVFGVTVTTELRDTLQAAQGLQVGAEDEANMPSLSSNLIRSLFTGQVTSWYDVVDANGTDLITLAGANAPAQDSVALCIRNSGSGARAQFLANFLRVPCLDKAVDPYLVEGGEWPMVQTNASSGFMAECLGDFGRDGQLQWAIGYQSTEKNVDLLYNYRFIKIDGAAPTLENVANDKYLDWVEQSLQYNTAAYNAADSLDQNVIDLIAEEIGQPAIIANLNSKNYRDPEHGYEHSWGQGGYMAKPTDQDGIQPPAFPFDLAYPVNRTTRSLDHGLNSCRPPVHVFYAWPGAVGF